MLQTEVTKRSKSALSLNFLDRVKKKDVVFFVRQLATMISASMPLVQSLKVLSLQTKNSKFKNIIDTIVYDIEEGVHFYEALSKHPNVFSNYVVGMVQSGEMSGDVSGALLNLAEQMESNYALQKKIIGAMIYPIAVVVIMTIVGIIMMTVVLPPLISIIAESGQEIPLVTKILMMMSDILKTYWWLIIFVIFGLVGVFVSIKKNPHVSYFWHTIQLRIPIVGTIIQNSSVYRLSSGLSTSLIAGLSIVAALEMVRNIMTNKVFVDIIDHVGKNVEEGMSMADSFAQHKEIPIIMSQMLKVGEISGKTDEILKGLGKFYRREVMHSIKGLVSAIEPIMIVLMGVGAAVLAFGVLLPIYQVSTAEG